MKLDGINTDSIFGEAPTPTAKTTTLPKKKKEGGRPSTIPTDFKKYNYKLDPDNVKALRAYCAANDESINMVLNDIIGEFVKKNQ